MSLSTERIAQLDQVFNARSVALIGATDAVDRVGYQLLEALVEAGYPGKIYPVHPRHKELLGIPVYPSVDVLPETVDLALIALNEHKTIEMVAECGRLGIKGAVCVAGGFKEVGEEGKQLELKLAQVARENHIEVIGPNTLGFFNADNCLNAAFYPERLPPGSGISVISQSGGIGRAIIEELRDEGLGINKWIGVGNRAALDFDDFVEYLSQDTATRVIGIFVEGTEKGREMMVAASKAARQKPVVVFRSGNSEMAKRSAITHTGSMISSPRLFSDACEQFGLLEVKSISEFVSYTKALAMVPPTKGDRIGIMTHTAGPSITIIDILAASGCKLAEFSPETMARLTETFAGIPVILKNPLDAAAFGYSPVGYGNVAEMVIADPNVDILIAIHSLHKNWKFAVPQLIKLREKYQKPVFACYISTQAGANENRMILQAAGIPLFTSIEKAAMGVAGYVRAGKVRHE